MSGIEEKYIEALCPGMKTLIRIGAVRAVYEPDFDGKGPSMVVEIHGKKNWIMIRHCPCCGRIIQNLFCPRGECIDWKKTQEWLEPPATYDLMGDVYGQGP
jgi:hypothetical protein